MYMRTVIVSRTGMCTHACTAKPMPTCQAVMPPGFSSASASGTWHSRLVYSGVASMLQEGICSSSCRQTRSPGAAAGTALADSAYSCKVDRTASSSALFHCYHLTTCVASRDVAAMHCATAATVPPVLLVHASAVQATGCSEPSMQVLQRVHPLCCAGNCKAG